FAHQTRRKAKRTADWLRGWALAAAREHPSTPQPEPAPVLPLLPGQEVNRTTTLCYTIKLAFKVFIGGLALTVPGVSYMYSPTLTTTFNGPLGIPLMAATPLVPFVAPLVVILRHLPGVIWPLRRPLETEDQPPSILIPSANPQQP